MIYSIYYWSDIKVCNVFTLFAVGLESKSTVELKDYITPLLQNKQCEGSSRDNITPGRSFELYGLDKGWSVMVLYAQ
jgi:hypothetical protein